MARPLLALNWKLHKGPAEASAWARALVECLPSTASADLALLAPFPSLPALAEALGGSPVAWGAQDVSAHARGAYTGEVAAAMLAEVGCAFAVVGHSERRQYHGETDEAVAAKRRAAEDAGLVPIVCVGEGLEVRESGRAEEHTLAQLAQAVDGLEAGSPELARLVVAYEPVWAIGTGRSATPDDAEAMGRAMRGFLADRFGADSASRVRLLYGGSVKPDNIASLCARKDVDGALVGGASLELESVLAMLAAIPERA